MKPTNNGLNGSKAYKITLKDCLNRRDELDAMQVTDHEAYAWLWMQLAADFDSLRFTFNAEKCREKGTYYFGIEMPADPQPEVAMDYTDV